MIYGYIRTSTDKQNNENQRFEIEQFANNNNLKINHWIEETISSRKIFQKLKLLECLKLIMLNITRNILKDSPYFKRNRITLRQ